MRPFVMAFSLLLVVACTPHDTYDEPGRIVLLGDLEEDPISMADWLLDFGPTPVGVTATRTLVLHNVGSEAVELQRLEARPPFATDFVAAGTLGPGDLRLVRVSFSPAEPGARESILTVKSSGRQETIRLVGAGEPVAACRPELDRTAVFTWSEEDQQAERFIERTIDIRNTGDADCAVESVGIRGNDAYVLLGSSEHVVRPGASASIRVSFNPFGSDEGDAYLDVVVDGVAYSVVLQDEERLVGPCDLVLRADSLAFGTVAVGSENVRTLEIRNRGAELCPAGSVEIHGEGFSAVDSVEALEAGATTTLDVGFRPSHEGTHRGGVTVAASESVAELPILGHAVESCAVHTQAIDFGEILPGCATSEEALLVGNRCSEPLILNGIEIPQDGGATEVFKVRRRPAALESGIAVPAYEMLEFTLAYVPEVRGLVEGRVLLHYANHPSTEAALSGTGSDSPLQEDNFSQDSSWGLKTRFFLTNQPEDLDGDGAIQESADEIRVELDGIAYASVDGGGALRWEYVPELNAVDFHPGFVPEDGADVRITYRVPCLPP